MPVEKHYRKKINNRKIRRETTNSFFL